MTKACECGHPKTYHTGDIDHPTCCRQWPMPGQWAECPCTEYRRGCRTHFRLLIDGVRQFIWDRTSVGVGE